MSMLAHVIVRKFAEHQPLHRQKKMFERQGARISRKTLVGGCLRSPNRSHRSVNPRKGVVRVKSDRNP